MNARLPVIVGFGGFNAAGRSSGHLAYRRMIFESLDAAARADTAGALAAMMGGGLSEDEVLRGTLVRKIGAEFFDVDSAALTRRVTLNSSPDKPASFVLARRQLPSAIPAHWQIEPLDEEGREFRVTLIGAQDVRLNTYEPMAVKVAGQLPQGFDPSSRYRSAHHPRGLQMAILAASDAVHSLGIPWQQVASQVDPDQVCVYSASIMSQLDSTGFGGLFNGRSQGDRATSRQVALGMNSMPADFINAYVLGSLGATGGTTGACATFLYNLRQGVDDIRSGRRQVAVVGASEAPILPEIIDGYGAMGALATDVDLQKLDRVAVPDYRRASRPFGENCGFTIAESSQYVVLMSDDLALSLGAHIYGAVPAVYINADGHKKSISAPGPGNYITMAKAAALVRSLLGEEALQRHSEIQAHGSSTPQNRTSESKIYHEVAQAFGIERWPLTAVKAYLGHSLATASGDQLAATLGMFEHGILPGIKTIDEVAGDVHDERLAIPLADQELGRQTLKAVFLNSKGFGGNNATAPVFSPEVCEDYLQRRHGSRDWQVYQSRVEATRDGRDQYLASADAGHLQPIYAFGEHMIDEHRIDITADAISVPGYEQPIALGGREGFDQF